ncbi:MAG: FadR family transcriptional regulator [Chloroflexi bacterium]|nr:FadR family transcriptional regulator [Chloroflexota bacterium]
MVLKPITPQKVYLQAMNQIRALIEEGHYKPGDRLPAERLLSEQLAISRPSVREALSALQALGLIRIKAGGGAFVAQPHDGFAELLLSKEDSPLEILEARLAIEPSLAELSARKRTDGDLKSIKAILDDMAAELVAGRHPVDGDRAFHLAIAKAAHNDILYVSMSPIVERMSGPIWYEVKKKGLSGAGLPFKYHEQHVRLYDAIEKGDARRAKAVMRAHVEGITLDLFQEVGQQ